MRGFVNPYNFIHFPSKKEPAYEDQDMHTGVIHYTLTTKTPLFIPNSSSETAFRESKTSENGPKEKLHKSYDFYSYTELESGKKYDTGKSGDYHVPVIPGSEMRGTVRNAYETLTDSCMGLLNEEEYPVKRSMEKFESGLIYRNPSGELSLYSASSLRIGAVGSPKTPPAGFDGYRNGTCVYYREPEQKDKNRPGVITRYGLTEKEAGGNEKGYLLKWGMGMRKKRYHLYCINENENAIEISSKDIVNKLHSVLESYLAQPDLKTRGTAEKAYREYRKDLETFLKAEGEGYFPVNYSKAGEGILYLSPAYITKELSVNSIGNLAGEFAPCKIAKGKKICPACDLFGYVGADNRSCKGSKIRFSDLYVAKEKEPEEYYYSKKNFGKITLASLGEPKLGNTEFYLQKPGGADFWTYDYYTRGGNTYAKPGVLRGRKYYWHHRKVEIENAPYIKPGNLNKTIRPVREKVVFEGQLYFESISEKQLKQLIWILNSGTEKLGLKLGGAKPLGFGSVSCEVQKVCERKIWVEDGKLNYKADEEYTFQGLTYKDAELSTEVKDEFYRIANLEAVPEDVEITYPKTRQQRNRVLQEGYQWFVHNHRKRKGRGMIQGRTDIKVEQTLPSILEEDFSIKYN